MYKNDPIIIRCNTITFRPVGAQKIRNCLTKIKDSKTENVIDKLHWQFSSYFCQKAQPQKLLLICKKITIFSLIINECKFSLVVNCISHINFQKLMNLELNGNRITSLEQLYSFNMPVLLSLSLACNKFCSIRGIQRSYLPNLKTLKLNGIINDIYLDSVFMYSYFPKLQQLSIDKCIGCQNILKRQNIQKIYLRIYMRDTFIAPALKRQKNKYLMKI